jgi:uncharacterized membrane protein
MLNSADDAMFAEVLKENYNRGEEDEEELENDKIELKDIE